MAAAVLGSQHRAVEPDCDPRLTCKCHIVEHGESGLHRGSLSIAVQTRIKQYAIIACHPDARPGKARSEHRGLCRRGYRLPGFSSVCSYEDRCALTRDPPMRV